MKSLSHFLVCIGALSLFTVGCERHDFEKTKILHLGHGGEHHEGDHKGDKDHAKEGDHAKGHEKEKAEDEKPEKEEGRDVGI